MWTESSASENGDPRTRIDIRLPSPGSKGAEALPCAEIVRT
jgi:hypothetical protein